MATKKVYRNSVPEWFVATSLHEAKQLARDWAARFWAECEQDGFTTGDLKECPDGEVLTIDIGDNGTLVSKTCAEWAAERPVGFLAMRFRTW